MAAAPTPGAGIRSFFTGAPRVLSSEETARRAQREAEREKAEEAAARLRSRSAAAQAFFLARWGLTATRGAHRPAKREQAQREQLPVLVATFAAAEADTPEDWFLSPAYTALCG